MTVDFIGATIIEATVLGPGFGGGDHLIILTRNGEQYKIQPKAGRCHDDGDGYVDIEDPGLVFEKIGVKVA